MPELQQHDIERLRRSLAMISQGDPCGWPKELAMEIVVQLRDVTAERDRLLEELVQLGYA